MIYLVDGQGLTKTYQMPSVACLVHFVAVEVGQMFGAGLQAVTQGTLDGHGLTEHVEVKVQPRFLAHLGEKRRTTRGHSSHEVALQLIDVVASDVL